MGAGKGDKQRPRNEKNWDRNYVLIFGRDCKNCDGTGKVHVVKSDVVLEDCPFCKGLGRVDKYAR